MGTFWDILLAVVCAAGLALVGWWLFGLLLRPLPGREARVVLPGRGDGEKLEQPEQPPAYKGQPADAGHRPQNIPKRAHQQHLLGILCLRRRRG